MKFSVQEAMFKKVQKYSAKFKFVIPKIVKSTKVTNTGEQTRQGRLAELSAYNDLGFLNQKGKSLQIQNQNTHHRPIKTSTVYMTTLETEQSTEVYTMQEVNNIN